MKAKIGMAIPVDPSPLRRDSIKGVSWVIAPASIPSTPSVGSSGSIGVMIGESKVAPTGSFEVSENWFAM